MDEVKNNLTKRQKLALSGLIVFGIFVIGLWSWNFHKQISGPFLARYEINNNQQSQSVQNEEEKQKSQDTDGDGLSDWDELNVYNTSPYIEDSDSDGIKDGAEVKNGTNPNCPQGRDCNATSATTPAAAISTASGTAESLPGLSAEQVSSSASDLSEMLSGQSDALTLRKLLLEAGMNKSDLDKISDEVLLDIYQDQLKKTY